MATADKIADTPHSESGSPAAPVSTASDAAPGGPLMIDIELIDEDPEQPRTKDNPGFTTESIAELSASFGPNGPKSPVSLRVNPSKPGRYLINHGARRTRASRLKGLSKIPAFIDNDYSEVDQFVENLQRDNLTPREIADWIGRKLAKGMKKGEIAKSVGKSAAFVSQHANLLNLPATIASVFNAGRTNDVTVVNELVTAFKKNPTEVAAWLADEQREITRGGVKLLREFLDEKSKTNPVSLDSDTDDEYEHSSTLEATRDGDESTKPDATDFSKLKKAILLIEYDGRPARLLLTRRPSATGYAWIKYEDNGTEFEGNLVDVKLVAVLEG